MITPLNVILPIVLGENKKAAIPIVNNVELTSAGSSYTLKGDINNAGLTDAKSMVVTVGTSAKAVEPYAQYAIGSLAADDFSSFEITFTTTDLSSVPLVITWKDKDGNSFSITKNLNLRTSSGSSKYGQCIGQFRKFIRRRNSHNDRKFIIKNQWRIQRRTSGRRKHFRIRGQEQRGNQFLLSCHCHWDYHHSRYRDLDEAEMDCCKT